MFLLGTAGFTVASILCGVAPSTGTLIAARLLQGVFGALMLPQGLGLLREVFPREELPKAFAVFGPVMGMAALLGPIIAGALIDLDLFSTGWRSVFLVNVPLGVAGFAGAARLVPPSRAGRREGGLDLRGTALVSVAAVLVVYPLIQGRALGWPAWTYASIALGVAAFGAFGLHLRRYARAGREPLVTPTIFAHRGYTGGLIVLMGYFAGMIGCALSATLFMQIGQHFSAIHAGLTMIPFPLGTVFTIPISGGPIGARNARRVIQAGIVVTAIGYAMLIPFISGHTTTWEFLPPLFVAGLGMGLFMGPLFNSIVGSVSDRETGSASGVMNAMQQLSGATGIAVLGTVFFAAAAHGDFVHALQRTMWWDVALMGVVLLATPLLPKVAPTQEEVFAVQAAEPVPA
jgi:MFS family permease